MKNVEKKINHIWAEEETREYRGTSKMRELGVPNPGYETLTKTEFEKLYSLVPTPSANVLVMLFRLNHLRLLDEENVRRKTTEKEYKKKKEKYPLTMIELHHLRKHMLLPNVPSILNTLIWLDGYGLLSPFYVRQYIYYYENKESEKYAKKRF